MNIKKIVFYSIWLALVVLGPISVFSNTPFTSLNGNTALTLNVIQRVIGLLAFTLLFIQLILGSFMTYWTQKLGGWIFNFHVIEGIVIYLLILGHPIFFMGYRYMIGQGFDPFYIFISVCAFCKTRLDTYYNLGRVAFWFVTIAVGAGLFRTATPFMRVHWRKFHILNYFAFLIVGVHSLMLGSDLGTPPFSYIHGPSLVIVGVILLYKGYLMITNKD